MKKILVPTDFSECANNALNFALQIAKQLSWEIVLVHTVEGETGIYGDYMGVQKDQEGEMLKEARQKLQLLNDAIRETEKVTIESQIYTGNVKENILTAIDNTKPELVVMGTMGTSGGRAEKIWGTKTAAITGSSNVPVIAVPYSYNWSKPAEILFTTNHFEKNTELLKPIFSIADLFNSRIHIVVFTNEKTSSGSDFVAHSRGLNDYEYFLKREFPGKNIVNVHLSGGGFEETLQQYIEENNIGMVVMISTQRGFWSRLAHPSATRSMAYHTTIPLLIIPDNNKS